MNEMDGALRMRVTGLTIDPFTNMPIVILKDESEQIALPIWIGLIEASAIATEIEKVEMTRPMTHDIIKKMMQELGAKLLRVEIHDLMDNTFFARMILQGPKGQFILDSRPSDALALALRCGGDILVARKVVEKSRQLATTAPSEDRVTSEKWAEILENLTTEDFGKYKM